MTRHVDAGELRTRITVYDLPRDEKGEVLRDDDGYKNACRLDTGSGRLVPGTDRCQQQRGK